MPLHVENAYELKDNLSATLTIRSGRGQNIILLLPLESLSKVIPYKWYWNTTQLSAQSVDLFSFASGPRKIQLHHHVVQITYDIFSPGRVSFYNPCNRQDLTHSNLMFPEKYAREQWLKTEEGIKYATKMMDRGRYEFNSWCVDEVARAKAAMRK